MSSSAFADFTHVCMTGQYELLDRIGIYWPTDDGTSRLFDQHGGHQEYFGHGKSASFKLRHDL